MNKEKYEINDEIVDQAIDMEISNNQQLTITT